MKEKDELLDGNYDGIQEFDNDLPRWWVNMFWLTTVFGLGYLLWMHVIRDNTQHEQLAKDLAELEQFRNAISAKSESASISEESLVALVSNQAALSKGKEVYSGKCAVCHGAEGQGLIGPNMTDNYWIHGAKALEMRKTILIGVPEKGMLAWNGLLTDDEINSVIAYLWTLRGSNPPNPKAAEGTLIQ